MTPATFIEGLASLRFHDVFNPYSDACPDHDVADAPLIRRRNLTLVVEAAMSRGVDAMWVARDLGYRGGRRTGLALTDDVHLASHAGLYGRLPLERATRAAVAERTASVVWRVLAGMGRPVFLWNVFPLHPHGASSALTNRAHTRKEREAAAHLMRWLLAELRPRTLVAIGRDAEAAVAQLGVRAEAVRHPSYGGQGEFVTQMSALYGPFTRSAPGTQLKLC